MTDSTRSPHLSRRRLLAGATAGVAATAGCVDRIRQLTGSGAENQLTLDIMTLPAEIDPFGVRIANTLRANLEAIGIDTTLTLVDARNLTDAVLLRHEFDIYVGELPFTRSPDPDTLYPLFRSTFDTAVGWQNPFGFVNLGCDDLLDSQRAATDNRDRAVEDLQRLLAQTQPISPLVAPDLLTGVRTDSFEADSWNQEAPVHPHNLLQLSPTGDEPGTLGLAVVADDIDTNRNPISARYRQSVSLVDLLYDSLALKDGDEYIPWAAREYSWDDSGDRPEVTVRLRDGLRWHDDDEDERRLLTAYDVRFSYEFLQDTSLRAASRPIPTERFRGELSLVEDVQVENARTLRISFTETTPSVAERALAVPILPAHIWRSRTELERSSSQPGQTTAALRTSNAEAIGSGPIQFEEEDDELVEFSLFEDHFLWRSRTPPAETDESNDSSDTDAFAPPPDGYGDRPFEQLVVEIVGSDNAAVELLTAGEVDVTIARLRPSITGPIESDGDMELIEHRSNGFYHLGFNTRQQPLRNPNVRRLIARLLDKPTLIEEHFDGYGVPVASLLAETAWESATLQWDGDTDPEVPFFGTDGELDVEQARERFRTIGYEYTENNELITR